MPDPVRNDQRSRREFITVAVSAASLALPLRAVAADKVDPADELATALSYTHDSQVGGSNCSNCQFYANAGDEWSACQIFTGNLVKGTGHCTSWLARG